MIIEAVVGGTLVVAGQLSGRVLTRLKGPKPYKPPKQPPPICGCTHHYAVHDEQGCHATFQVLVERGEPTKMQTGYDGLQHKVFYAFEKYVQAPCGCRRYTGPEPMPEMISL